MSLASSGPTPPAPPGVPPRLSQRIPWEKLLIWGLFLVGIYALRHLFFIIFMTFLFSFLVRTVTVWLARWLSPTEMR